MEVYGPKIKKFLILSILSSQNFSLKKFLIFFTKKPRSEKILHIFSKNMFFLYFGIWNFLIFSQKKFFLYFGKWNFFAPRLTTFLFFQRKTFLIFQEIGLSIPKNFPSSKKNTRKIFFIFWKMELSSHKLKKFPYFF